GLLGRGAQPLAELLQLLGRGLVDQQRVDGTQLVQDRLAGVAAIRLEVAKGALATLCLRGDVLRQGLDELAVAAVPRGLRDRPERRTGLLERLERPTGIGDRDRHRGYERRPPQPRPLIVGELAAGGHDPTLPVQLLVLATPLA